VGAPGILEELRGLAPGAAVRGNVDRGAWAEALPATAVVEVGAVCLYVLHDLAELDLDPVAAGFAAVLSGHTHQPSSAVRDGVLYLNPGSAGPRRFHLPVTVARVTVSGAPVAAEIVELAV
jgi:predicted phosphodiesterase